MPELKPPVELELSENEERVKYILEEASNSDFSFPEVRKLLSCVCMLHRVVTCIGATATLHSVNRPVRATTAYMTLLVVILIWWFYEYFKECHIKCMSFYCKHGFLTVGYIYTTNLRYH